MKEVKKCSISGIAFTLDADAYALLSRYLDSLKATYAETADGDEIVADIEARIAELILSQQENSRVVETPLLRQIISQMGTAEDISSESETDAAKKQPRIPRRLYRDTENARLGGVCAGLGRYFDVDATWVRLTLFAPLLLLILVEVLPFSGTLSTFFSNLFGVFVLGYFIMWFAVPAARSARQKLEMEGEPITVRSIREKTVRDSETNSDVKSIVARVIYALGQLALIVIKIFIGFFIFGLTFAACILLIVLFALIFGLIGFVDDYRKVRQHQNEGLTARQKFILQLAAAVVFLVLMRYEGLLTNHLYIPFVNTTVQVNWILYLIFAAFVIVGCVNAVNLTDGIDGLACSVTFVVAAFFVSVAALWKYTTLGVFSSALLGGLAAFFVYNHHPAKTFMGDTGSLFLGGAVAALGFAFDMPLILIPVGIIYIAETMSDIIQVTYFKATHGKRFFKMAPLHHHLELSGWSEAKLVAVFSLVTLAGCVLAYLGVQGRF